MVHTKVPADALKSINNAERRGKYQVLTRLAPVSFCDNMIMKHDYTSEFEINDCRVEKTTVNLTGRSNKCGVISP
uniref:40S ribosomal protein S15a n=1 Tax=Capra hircus TaxID=9925 RepID=A0A8C2NFD9_CAPHI